MGDGRLATRIESLRLVSRSLMVYLTKYFLIFSDEMLFLLDFKLLTFRRKELMVTSVVCTACNDSPSPFHPYTTGCFRAKKTGTALLE